MPPQPFLKGVIIMAENIKEEIAIEEKASEEAASSVQTVTFRKPVKYAGKEYTELSFDFSKLTGQDALSIENELSNQSKNSGLPAMNSEYLIRLAARACTENVGSDIFAAYMSMSDHLEVIKLARSFLLRGV